MDILHKLVDYFQSISGILTGLAAIVGFFITFGKKFIKNWHNKIKAKEKMIEKIDRIYSELTPNHGSSLKDKVDKMEMGLEENTKITKETTEMLKTVTTRQQWILDMQESPIFESDSEGLCIWANEKYVNLICRNKEDLFGNGWKNFIHEDDRKRVIEEWESAVKEERSSQSNYRMVSKCGNVYEVECYAQKHKGNGYTGKIIVK
jgi:PAS domain-containing protein